ncbi:hypothetical protein B0H14DRAFT_2638351 [Mycena olivaceomarginata]|nr:hypothetical protein B0H14DRAFT_2638351 [Mycena olivaceomarginata]
MGVGWVEHWSSALGANPEIRRVGPLGAVAKLKKLGKVKQTAEPTLGGTKRLKMKRPTAFAIKAAINLGLPGLGLISSTMSRRKRPPKETTAETGSLGANEKRRQRAAEYRRRPEIREKQRIIMAERRAAAKARRRQWDPPKKPKPEPIPPSPEQLNCSLWGVLAELKQSQDAETEPRLDAVVTDEMLLALGKLAQLKQSRTITALRKPSMASDQVMDGALQITMPIDVGLSEVSPSETSSVEAVHEEPVRRPHANNALQKKIRRELGITGPLTGIQIAQLKAYELGRPSSRKRHHQEDEAMDSLPHATRSFLSTARRQGICMWRQQLTDFEKDWDMHVRRDFAEQALRGWGFNRKARLLSSPTPAINRRESASW